MYSIKTSEGYLHRLKKTCVLLYNKMHFFKIEHRTKTFLALNRGLAVLIMLPYELQKMVKLPSEQNYISSYA